jgi:hypothetical protein
MVYWPEIALFRKQTKASVSEVIDRELVAAKYPIKGLNGHGESLPLAVNPLFPE